LQLRLKIRGKMIALIALPTAVIYVVVLGLTMAHLRGKNRVEIEQEVTRLAVNTAARFDGAFREAAAIAITTARFMETAPDLSEAQIFEQLSANVDQNPVVYGAAIAFEPGSYKRDDSLFCPYVYRGQAGLERMDITRDVLDWYDDETWQWWHRAKGSNRGIWTDPYFDEGAGNVLMVTYSEPFERDGVFRGVTTIDIKVRTLRESIGRHILADLDFAMFTSDGRYVFSTTQSDIMAATVFEVFEKVGRPDIVEAARHVVSGETGVVAFEGWDDPPATWKGWVEPQWVFYSPIESTGWAFAAVLPEREALAGVHARMTMAAIALAGTLVLIIGCIWLVSGLLARPIIRLRTKVLEIAGGNLNARVEGITSHDEIGELAESFNTMTADLRTHVEHLAHERASRAKIERDLDLAREIQRGLLPKTEPNAPGFEIAGWNQAADKTGGDYFDWLELPDGRTVMTLADVTGHGIGPALIVAVCRAYMRASASAGHGSLSVAMARVNDLLHEDIPDGRFVTAAVGVLDPSKAQMKLISAGQAPLLFYEARTDTVHNWDADDLPLGIAGGLTFEDVRTIDFATGDALVLATDGFFEWANRDREQFGTKRMEDVVRENHELPPHEFITRLYEIVLEHASGTEQADDLTAVVIKKI
jgi:sigma-B regulation protein RsbU (phosphoserine phosphatase)